MKQVNGGLIGKIIVTTVGGFLAASVLWAFTTVRDIKAECPTREEVVHMYENQKIDINCRIDRLAKTLNTRHTLTEDRVKRIEDMLIELLILQGADVSKFKKDAE